MEKENIHKQSFSVGEQKEENPRLLQIKNSIKEITTGINTLIAAEQLSKTEQEKQIETKIVQLIRLETQFHNIKQLLVEQKPTESLQGSSGSIQKPQLLKQQNETFKEKVQQIIQESLTYEPTKEDIQQRRNAFNEYYEDNEDGWTDATHSNVGTEDLNNELMVFDDEMLDQMGIKGDDNDPSNLQSSSEESEVDYEQLQEEFVKGKPSNEHFKWGQHKDKFCVSVLADIKRGYVASGGGDDKLLIYSFVEQKEAQTNDGEQDIQSAQTQKGATQLLDKKEVNQGNINDREKEKMEEKEEKEGQNRVEEKEKTSQAINERILYLDQPFKTIPHHQTVNQLEFSWDQELIFSLTDKELLCTSVKDWQTVPVPIDPLPENLACHKFGGVFAASNGYNVEIFNIKGFKYYDSFCLDEQVNILKWTNDGKQLLAACDNKLRIITMKSREVQKCSGKEFHHGEITTLSATNSTIFTGCIDGYVYATNISKGNVLGGTPKMEATINTLKSADNYLLVGPSINYIYWYDSNKLKRLFETPLKGSSTDIIEVRNKNEFAISDLQGEIHLVDRRTPLEAKLTLEAGNTVHQLYFDHIEGNTLLAACEDGCVRGWDLRKFN